MENVAAMYIKRSQDVLDSTSKASFDILINVWQGGPWRNISVKPFNPLEDIKPTRRRPTTFFTVEKPSERYLTRRL